MSGIAGIVRLDGAPVASSAIDAMAAAIAHRGPDGNGIRSNGSVAFAHATLHTTAESRHEPQPFVDGELSIVADVRLDNRAELLSLLGIRHESIGDAAILLAAYRKWDHDLLSRIEGDFAFAIWNERNRTLFCARDPFGVKQFAYAHLPRTLFAFGSEVRALLALEEIPRHFDEKRIADFLAVSFGESERTFHRAVRRLPGGCSLTLRDGEIVTERYWSPEHIAPLRLRGADRDAQYAEGYRAHFVRAVRERMRSADLSQIGSMLSGGLDSTSIACVARDELRAANAGPLPVFSWVFSDHMEADERAYQEATIAEGGMRAITLDSAQIGATPWTDIDALLPDGPPYAPNHYLNSVAARHARDNGVTVMLDGIGGDSTISRGRGRYHELFFRGRLPTLARELRALAHLRGTDESLPRLFYANVAAPLMPPSLLASVQRLRGRATIGDAPLRLLSSRMLQLSDARAGSTWFVSARREHLSQLISPMLAEGLELLDRANAMHAVEVRYPFFDRRLAEYCYSLPADQKLSDGYTRIVARRALAGVLPEKVQWRAGKGMPGMHILSALRRDREMLDDLLIRNPDVIAPYVNMDVVLDVYTGFLSERPLAFRTVMELWSVAILARWMRAHAERQNVLSA